MPSHATNVLALSPRLFLRLGEASGTTAVDSSGLGRNGTYAGSGVTYGTTDALIGDGNKAISAGNADAVIMVSVPTNSDYLLNLGSGNHWSLECLANQNTQTSSWPTLMGFGTGWATDTWMIYYTVPNTQFSFLHNSTDYVSQHVANDATWHHIVLTWDGTSLVWYIDNVASSSTPTAVTGGTTTNPLTLLDSVNGGTTTKASIDEVAIYNFALTSGQVSTLYASLGSVNPVADSRIQLNQAINRSYTY